MFGLFQLLIQRGCIFVVPLHCQSVLSVISELGWHPFMGFYYYKTITTSVLVGLNIRVEYGLMRPSYLCKRGMMVLTCLTGTLCGLMGE